MLLLQYSKQERTARPSEKAVVQRVKSASSTTPLPSKSPSKEQLKGMLVGGGVAVVPPGVGLGVGVPVTPPVGVGVAVAPSGGVGVGVAPLVGVGVAVGWPVGVGVAVTSTVAAKTL